RRWRLEWRWRRLQRWRRNVRRWRRERLMVMTRTQLLKSIDSNRVKQAIEQAEDQTSGEIVVSVAPLFWGSVDKLARRTFVRLGVNRTQGRNGVLFFIVPSRRLFVVLGDQGIHEKVGQEFWNAIAGHLTRHFRDRH